MVIRLGQRSPTGQWRQRLIDADWIVIRPARGASHRAGGHYQCHVYISAQIADALVFALSHRHEVSIVSVLWDDHLCYKWTPACPGSDNGLSPGRRQEIISTNAAIYLIGPLGTNFNEIYDSQTAMRSFVCGVWLASGLTRVQERPISQASVRATGL